MGRRLMLAPRRLCPEGPLRCRGGTVGAFEERQHGARRRALSRALAAILLSMLAAPAAAIPPSPPAIVVPGLAGRSLSEALGALQRAGWPVVFSSELVRPAMRVEEEPRGDSARAVLESLVRPHGLALREGARGRLVVVAAPPPGRAAVRPDPPPAAPPPAVVAPATVTLSEEIVVKPPVAPARQGVVLRPLDVAGTDPSPPRLSDDPLVALRVLPGASTDDGSGGFSLRGGDRDEVQVRLDGLDLIRPFHLGDFDAAISFVPAAAVERAEVYGGGYPAQYGDRLGGVVDLSTREPTGPRHFSLGVGLLGAEGAVSGRMGERLHWLASARGGSYQWPLELSGRDQHPRYADAFGKIGLELSPRHDLLIDALAADDGFELSSAPGLDVESYSSEWSSRYFWLRHAAVASSSLYVETVAGTGSIDHDRSGASALDGSGYRARDRRDLDLDGLRQDWHWEWGARGTLEWGFDLERSDTLLEAQVEGDLPSHLAPSPGGVTAPGSLERRLDGSDTAGYLSTELRPASTVVLDLGLRYDRSALDLQSHLSPRLGLAWELDRSTVVRASWGLLYQRRRPYELALEQGVEDGLPGFGTEGAEERELAIERRLPHRLTLGLAAYERLYREPWDRFENLFEGELFFPELGEDRVRVSPDGGGARGVELSLRRERRRRFGWWVTYARSVNVDRIDGIEVPRSNDQPDSFRLGLSTRLGRVWSLDVLWHFHTGWPTTAVEAVEVGRGTEGPAWTLVPGPRNGERLPDYHRLDLRLGRSWQLGAGRVTASLDLLDVYDRANLRGFEGFHLEPDGNGGFVAAGAPVRWGGFTPALSLRWAR